MTAVTHFAWWTPRKAYSLFALCDEAYALMTSKEPETLTSGRILWTQLSLLSGTGACVLVANWIAPALS